MRIGLFLSKNLLHYYITPKVVKLYSQFTLSFGVNNESFQDIDEVGSVERITTNTDDGGLTKTSMSGLVNSLIGQSTRSGDDT